MTIFSASLPSNEWSCRDLLLLLGINHMMSNCFEVRLLQLLKYYFVHIYEVYNNFT